MSTTGRLPSGTRKGVAVGLREMSSIVRVP